MSREVNEKFIVKLQGKDFILYNGLVDLAHQDGLISLESELIQLPSKDNDMTAIAKATAKTKDKIFTDIGDASPSSVSSMLKPHIIRMASTRAKARALRDLTNVGMTAVEEMIEDEAPKQNYGKPQGQAKTSEDLQAIKDNSLASEKQLQYIYSLAKKKNYTAESMASFIKNNYNKNKSEELTSKEASELIKTLQDTKK